MILPDHCRTTPRTEHVMRRKRAFGVLVAVSMLAAPECGKQPSVPDVDAHRREIEAWRQDRLQRLTSDDGWLTLAGLFWLHQGENTCGSDTSNDVVFPAGKAPQFVGAFWLEDGTVRFVARPGVDVTHEGVRIRSLSLQSDTSSAPTRLRLKTLSFYVIDRGGRLGVRVKDMENPARLQFVGLEYFPIDLRWRFDAMFEPYDPPKPLRISSQANTVEEYAAPGALAFEQNGTTYRIDAVIETGADELFIMFNDETNGEETYGGGRQLYAPLPDSGGHVVLDFNKAYNWPCVFTEFATCPIPPPQNRLPIRVEAGEKMYAPNEQMPPGE